LFRSSFYQYDAWGRVVQVNQASVAGGSPGGVTDTLTVGALVKHFTYDGVGRLIAVRSPRPGPSGANTSGSNVPVRDEHLYYDGIRRVQEVVHDFSTPDGNGDRELQVALLTREYIWGPGDGPAGVDELLAMFDGEAQGKPWWVLQDAGGDIVAICESPQPGGPGTTLSPARVAGQWVYDAYGAALTAETLHPHPELHGGHKGLFFDRLDGDVAASSAAGADETARLEPAATLLVYMRNRSYLPHQGRFLQMDPNQTAMVVLAMVDRGAAIAGAAGSLHLRDRFTDGGNLHGYLRGNPWRGQDPLGLLFTFPDILATNFQLLPRVHYTMAARGLSGFLQNLLGGASVGLQGAAAMGVPGITGSLASGGAVASNSALAFYGLAASAAIVTGIIADISGTAAASEIQQGAPDLRLYRGGTRWESLTRLTRKCEEAEAAGSGYGVSFTSGSARFTPASAATISQLSAAGFEARKTGGPGHFTVLFRNPVTSTQVDAFNLLLQRSRQ